MSDNGNGQSVACELPLTTMQCGCVFETPPEGPTPWNRYRVVCDHHADYPDFQAFKRALATEAEPESRRVIERFNERFNDETEAALPTLAGRPIPIRGCMKLTTIGAKSKLARTVPVSYQRLGQQFVLVGSTGGRARNPDWYFNLLANSDVTLEVSGRTFRAQARVTAGQEREALIEECIRIRPMHEEFFARARATIKREIPVVVLDPEVKDLPTCDDPLD